MGDKEISLKNIDFSNICILVGVVFSRVSITPDIYYSNFIVEANSP